MPNRTLVREFSWLTLGNQSAALSGMLALVVLTRQVSMSTVGQVVFAQATASIVLLVVDVRFEDAVQRYFPELSLRRDGATATQFFLRMCRWDLCLGLVVIGGAFGTWATGLLPTQGIWDPLFVMIALIAAGTGTVMGTLQSGYAVTSSLSRLGKVISATSLVNLVTVTLGALGWGATGFLWGQVLGTAFQLLALVCGLASRLPRDNRGIEPTGNPQGLVPFLAKSSAASTLAAGGDAGVLFAAGLFASPQVVALLKVAQAPGRIILTACSPLAVQLFPRLSMFAANGQVSQIRLAVGRVSRSLALLSFGGVLLASVLLPVGLELVYGAAYRAAALAALLYVFGAGARSVVVWAKVLPLAIDRPTLRLAAVGVESLVLVIVTAVLAQGGGVAVEGVASVYAVTGVLVMAFWIATSRGEWLYMRVSMVRKAVLG